MVSRDDPPHEDTAPSSVCEASLPTGLEPANPIWPQEVTIKRFFWLAILLWSILIGILAAMDYRQDKDTHVEIAIARDTFSRDLLYRRWATEHGGVYVPATPETPPNPYLSHISERDIVTPSARELTLMNPAYMTRQVHELGPAQYGMRGHISATILGYGIVWLIGLLGAWFVRTCLLRSLSERRQAEDALRESEEKYRLLFDKAGDAIFIHDEEARMLAANNVACDRLGYTRAELMSMAINQVDTPDQAPNIPERISQLMAQGYFIFETVHQCKDGTHIPTEVISRRIIWEGRRAMMSVCRDITRHKQYEESLRNINCEMEATVVDAMEMAVKAEAATTAKSRFLTNMSHEIRTPLNAIIGFSQLMKGDPEISFEQRKRLETIHRNGEYLLELINDILELSKIEAGRTVLNPITFDLHALFRDLTTMFQPKARDRNLSFITDGLHLVPQYLITDELKLRQVLVNLLGNAMKFTQTGEVRLRVEVESVQQDGVLLVVWVEDTGPGIAAEEMWQLFEAFEQTATGHRNGRGTGLGLAISRRFARIMGGDLTATSEIGTGSRFRLEIPVQKGIASMVTEKTDPRQRFRLEAGQSPCRVLVADDMEDSRVFLVQTLENAGFEVQEADDGGEAVAAFSRWRPQLVLMDKRMPNMNGDEAIERIRRSTGGDEVKIITLSADATNDSIERTIAAGADAFMMKPFKIEEMFENIRVLTGVRYRCEKAASPDESPVPPRALTWEMVESIPDQLREQIYNAAVGCRQGKLFTLLEEITRIDPALSEKLRNIIEDLDYETLIELFDQDSRSDNAEYSR